jgi:hypothetical protein
MNNLITKSNPEEIKERLKYFYCTSKYYKYSNLFRKFLSYRWNKIYC